MARLLQGCDFVTTRLGSDARRQERRQVIDETFPATRSAVEGHQTSALLSYRPLAVACPGRRTAIAALAPVSSALGRVENDAGADPSCYGHGARSIGENGYVERHGLEQQERRSPRARSYPDKGVGGAIMAVQLLFRDVAGRSWIRSSRPACAIAASRASA